MENNNVHIPGLPDESQDDQQMKAYVSPTVDTPGSPIPAQIIGLPQGDVNQVTPSQVHSATLDNTVDIEFSKVLKLFLGLGAVVVVAIIVALYIWILPNKWANGYTSNIKPLYQTQAKVMSKAYASINRQVFSDPAASTTSNTSDLTYITGVVQDANNDTKALQTADSLRILPGTNWLQTVKQANSEYQAMQQYISNSEVFLSDYQTLAVYAQNILKIWAVQLPPLQTAFNSILSNQNSLSGLATASQSTDTVLQNFINQIKGLKPPTDLSEFNTNLLTDLSGMNDGLQGIINALNGSVNDDTGTYLAEFDTSTQNFVTLSQTNPFSALASDSTISSQISTLQTENPLP